MKFFKLIKHYFRSAFRELFVHHNSSLEFRAKLFALVAGVSPTYGEAEKRIIEEEALKIYSGDEDRATSLVMATKEYISKLRRHKHLGIDDLAKDITLLLKRNKRFVYKIDTEHLKPLVSIQEDRDTQDYQLHILEFLETLKKEHTKE